MYVLGFWDEWFGSVIGCVCVCGGIASGEGRLMWVYTIKRRWRKA